MSFESFDPRKTIRETIGTLKYDDEDNIYYYLSVDNNENDSVEIPLYLHEEIRSGELPYLPYIVMRILRVRYIPHNISATTREHQAILGILVQYSDTDDIDRTSFGKKILDELQNQIRTNQASITNMFMNINNVRQVDSNYGHQVVYGWNVELYVRYHDAC